MINKNTEGETNEYMLNKTKPETNQNTAGNGNVNIKNKQRNTNQNNIKQNR